MMNSRKISLIHKIPADKPASFVLDKYLFAVRKESCSIFDISNSKQPIHLSDIELTKDKSDTGTFPVGLLNGRLYFGIGYNGLDVFDFQNTRKPFRLGVVENFLTAPLHFLAKDYLLAAKAWSPTQARDLVLYDMRDPLSPTVVFDFKKAATSLLVVGNHLIVASSNGSLDLYDMSAPTAPTIIANLEIDVLRLFRRDDRSLVAEGRDYNLYLLDINNPSTVSVKAQLSLNGPLILSENGYVFTRPGRTTRRDTIYGYRFHNDDKLKKIFSVHSVWVTNQVTDGRILLLQGIKDYDGVSALPNYDTQRYSLYEMQDNKITSVGTIDLEGIFFSSLHLLERIVYIARRDGIYIYEV